MDQKSQIRRAVRTVSPAAAIVAAPEPSPSPPSSPSPASPSSDGQASPAAFLSKNPPYLASHGSMPSAGLHSQVGWAACLKSSAVASPPSPGAQGVHGLSSHPQVYSFCVCHSSQVEAGHSHLHSSLFLIFGSSHLILHLAASLTATIIKSWATVFINGIVLLTSAEP